MDGILRERLERLAAAEQRSKEAYEDSVSALHAAIREAEEAGKSMQWIADRVGMSKTHTHRIAGGITGPAAV